MGEGPWGKKPEKSRTFLVRVERPHLWIYMYDCNQTMKRNLDRTDFSCSPGCGTCPSSISGLASSQKEGDTIFLECNDRSVGDLCEWWMSLVFCYNSLLFVSAKRFFGGQWHGNCIDALLYAKSVQNQLHMCANCQDFLTKTILFSGSSVLTSNLGSTIDWSVRLDRFRLDFLGLSDWNLRFTSGLSVFPVQTKRKNFILGLRDTATWSVSANSANVEKQTKHFTESISEFINIAVTSRFVADCLVLFSESSCFQLKCNEMELVRAKNLLVFGSKAPDENPEFTPDAWCSSITLQSLPVGRRVSGSVPDSRLKRRESSQTDRTGHAQRGSAVLPRNS